MKAHGIPIFIFCIFLTLIFRFTTQNSEKNEDAKLTHRIFYGSVTEINPTDQEISFKIKMSEVSTYTVDFVFTEKSEAISTICVGDYVKVESEYNETQVKPGFKYPVIMLEVIQLE